jgi:hypothetical protein
LFSTDEKTNFYLLVFRAMLPHKLMEKSGMSVNKSIALNDKMHSHKACFICFSVAKDESSGSHSLIIPKKMLVEADLICPCGPCIHKSIRRISQVISWTLSNVLCFLLFIMFGLKIYILS